MLKKLRKCQAYVYTGNNQLTIVAINMSTTVWRC